MRIQYLEVVVADVEENLVVEVLPGRLVVSAGRQLSKTLFDGVQEGPKDELILLHGTLQVV